MGIRLEGGMRRFAIAALVGGLLAAGAGLGAGGRRAVTRGVRAAVQQARAYAPGVGTAKGQPWVSAYLREHQIGHTLHHHPVAYTAQELAAAEHVSGRQVAKVVIAWADNRLVMLVLPASEQVALERVATALGTPTVRLATEDEFAPAFPDCDVGAMPPFGERYGLPVYVDATLPGAEQIVCSAGTHTDTVTISYTDFARLTQPTVADFAAD